MLDALLTLADAGIVPSTGPASGAAAPAGLGQNLVALATLTALEIVLGIDNIVFISILTGRLEPSRQALARRIGLLLAMGTRVALLLAISWLMGLTREIFALPLPWEDRPVGITGKDLVLLLGGLFLIWKATHEIHNKLEGPEGDPHGGGGRTPSFAGAIVMIVLIDIVFSLDSVITAVAMAEALWVMIAAVVIAVLIMLAVAGKISHFIEKHPTLKMLALSFLLLIGVLLVADALHKHIPRGYIYFAMAFSLGVELLNMRIRKTHQPVHLHMPRETAGEEESGAA